MTLKEKILSDNYLEDYDNPITDYQADIIVERADDYAMKFAEHILDYHNDVTSDYLPLILEQFKKEKGL
jgi:hypothetical protein